MVGKYKVITLCGSTRFKDEFIKQQKRLALEGNIVISVDLFTHSGDDEIWDGMDEDAKSKTKIMLDDMHKRKIDMADEIFVINPGGYIGASTRSEIEYARRTGKKVRFLVHPLIGKEIILKKSGESLIVSNVIEFKEDTFGQGNYAVETKDGKYLYECEIEVPEYEEK